MHNGHKCNAHKEDKMETNTETGAHLRYKTELKFNKKIAEKMLNNFFSNLSRFCWRVTFEKSALGQFKQQLETISWIDEK